MPIEIRPTWNAILGSSFALRQSRQPCKQLWFLNEGNTTSVDSQKEIIAVSPFAFVALLAEQPQRLRLSSLPEQPWVDHSPAEMRPKAVDLRIDLCEQEGPRVVCTVTHCKQSSTSVLPNCCQLERHLTGIDYSPGP